MADDGGHGNRGECGQSKRDLGKPTRVSMLFANVWGSAGHANLNSQMQHSAIY